MNESLHTKFGNAKLRDGGYYQITSAKEGNFGKFLHRLIFEDFYNMSIPKGYVIHHKDKNKFNNCIMNLQLLSQKEHNDIHNRLSDKVCRSDNMNNTGFFRVTKANNPNVIQGYEWRYQYYENGKRKCLSSIDLFELEEKVIEKGLDWIELDN